MCKKNHKSIVKNLLIISLFLLSALCAYPQAVIQRSVIGSSGSTFSSGDTVVSFTVGETYTPTLQAGNMAVRQGFQQLCINPEVTMQPANVTVCAGNNVMFAVAATGTKTISYQWQHDGIDIPGAIDDTLILINLDVQDGGDYACVVTNPCKSVISNNATLTVHALPAPGISSSNQNTFCQAGNTTLTATAGYVSYVWSQGSSTNIIQISDQGTYTVTVTDHNGCSNSASIVVGGLPGFTASAALPDICAGQSTVVTASGATNYVWSGLGTGNPNTAHPTISTTYTVTGTTGHCTASASVTVNVHPVPAVTLAAAPNPVCSGSSTTLSAGGADSYTWGNNMGTGNIKVVAPVTNTTYFVTGTTEWGCVNSAKVTVMILARPAVTATANPAAVCLGSNTTLTGGGASTYIWGNGLGAGNPKITAPPATTTYTVTGTAVNGCSNTAKVTVTVKPVPTVTISSSSGTTLCKGKSTILKAMGASTYVWSTGAVTASITVAPTTTTNYTVTGTNTSGCTAKAIITITVNPLPVVTVVANPATVCAGSQSVLTAGGAYMYNWSNGTNGYTINVYPTVTTNYFVTGTSSLGCSSTAKVTVTVKPLPTVSASANPATVVAGGASTLTASGTANTYNWSNGYTGLSQIVHPVITTIYTVTGTTIATGCKKTATVTVNVIPKMLDANNDIPDEVILETKKPVMDCYPNPFNDRTIIRFILPDNDHALVEVYDITGKWIQTLYDADAKAQFEYRLEFDAGMLPSNMYLYRITTNGEVFTGKMMLHRK